MMWQRVRDWRPRSLWGAALIVGVALGAVFLAFRYLPVDNDKGCARILQFVGGTAEDPVARERLSYACGGVDVDRMLAVDYLLLVVYGTALAVICLLGAKGLYRGRLRTVAVWAGRGAVAAAVADALENLALLTVPDPVRKGERAADLLTLDLAQGFALVKWVALLPAAVISVLVGLTLLARLLLAGYRRFRPEPSIPPVLSGAAAGDRTEWARNYWLPDRHLSKGQIGISLSGGGIRSGTFALGALQVFAESGLLAKARYLTTVSGGGYTGAAHQLLRARGGRTDPDGVVRPHVTLKEAFAAGSPEEAHVRRHGKYIADGAAQWVRAILTVLRNVLVNLALFYGLLFLLARPLGWAYAKAVPWDRRVFFVEPPPDCDPPRRPRVEEFPCVWDWPDFPDGTWVAVAVPFALALVFWVANGWPAGDAAYRPGHLRRIFLELAGGLAVLGIVVAVVVVGLPVLVRVFQWLAAQSEDIRPPEIAVLVSLATVATTIWNMVSGKRASGQAGPSSRMAKLLSGVGFATRAITSFLVIAALAVLALVVLAGHLATAVRDFSSWVVRPPAQLDLAWVAVAAAILLFAVFFDETRLSLHPFYKRRLASAFAVERTSPRQAREIDYSIGTVLSEYARPVPDGERPPDSERPAIILCAAANVSGQTVAPPGRRVTSFVFAHDIIGGPGVGYLETAELERLVRGKPYRSDITLMAAMAISGAAFASAMGRMSGSFDILLAVTNARLGAWLPNPRYLALRTAAADEQPEAATGRPEPAPGLERWRPVLPHVRRLTYLAKEIFGFYSPDDRMVYVTDGGHYENLGLVELLRRRCQTIYCVDASGDTSLAQTLAQAALLAYEELGVEITIEDATLLSPSSAVDGQALNLDLRALERRLAAKQVVVGHVKYPPQAGLANPTGLLVVGKAVLTAELPYPLRAHAARVLQFPNEGTADQWFDVDQFNSYLALGRQMGERMRDAHRKGRLVRDEADPEPDD